MIQPDFTLDLYALDWWVEGTLVQSMLTHETSDGFVFLCEACGYDKPWGAKYFPNRAVTRFYSACARHPASRGEVPGSMILWWHDELEKMPAALVEREYTLHLNHYLKETDHAKRDTLAQAA